MTAATCYFLICQTPSGSHLTNSHPISHRTSHYKNCLLRVPVYFLSLCLIKAASEVNITDISSKYQFPHLLEDFSFQKQRITKI